MVSAFFKMMMSSHWWNFRLFCGSNIMQQRASPACLHIIPQWLYSYELCDLRQMSPYLCAFLHFLIWKGEWLRLPNRNHCKDQIKLFKQPSESVKVHLSCWHNNKIAQQCFSQNLCPSLINTTVLA
jgi:hypothetical protein